MEMPVSINRKQYLDQYYRLNRERIAARNHLHYLNNKEVIRQRFLDWKLRNLEKFKLNTKKAGIRYKLKYPGRRSEIWNRYYYRNHKKLSVHRSVFNKRVYPERKERLLAKNRNYHSENKTKIRVQQKEYRKRNALDRASYNKIWRLKNKEWIQRYRAENRHVEIRSAAKRRSLKRGASVRDLEAIKMWTRSITSSVAFRCYYCNRMVSSMDVHFDHILPLSKFKIHNITNLCASCPACNLSKGAKLPSEWIKHGQFIFDI